MLGPSGFISTGEDGRNSRNLVVAQGQVPPELVVILESATSVSINEKQVDIIDKRSSYMEREGN